MGRKVTEPRPFLTAAWRYLVMLNYEVPPAQFDCDVQAVYGPGFAECLSVRPRSAFLAEGSDVIVHRGRRLR
jgi:hypothetical protein